MSRPIIICDIDGVIADCSHRLKFLENKRLGLPANWDAFFDACDRDIPIPHAVSFVKLLEPHFTVVFVTGRPERTREKTRNWLIWHGFGNCRLFMRKDGDHRQDFEVKLDILWSHILSNGLDKSSIAVVIEDRDQVVEMWRAEGLLCLQPKKGDY